jgi:hypothetical protein
MKALDHKPPPCPCKYHARHRAEQTRHLKKLIALGFKGGVRNAARYMRKLEQAKAWNKAHPESIRAAATRQTRKIQAAYGNSSRSSCHLYFVASFERKLLAKRNVAESEKD